MNETLQAGPQGLKCAAAHLLAAAVLGLALAAGGCGGSGDSDPVSGGSAPDTTAPAVTLSTAANPTSASPFAVDVAFSEPVTGFDLADVAVTGGSAGGLTGSGAGYSFGVTPAADDTFVTVAVAAGAASDAAGNASTAAAPLEVFYNAQYDPADAPPTMTDITDKFVAQDGTLEFIVFDASEGPSPGEDAQVLTVFGVASSDQTLVPDGNITVSFTDNGAANGASGELTITPAAGETGTTTITVIISDGNSTVRDSFVLSVNAVTDPPTAFPLNVSLAQNDTNVPFTLPVDENPPGDTIVSYTIETAPAHGNLGGTLPDLTYTPDPGFSGRDRMTWYATDTGGENSNLAIVTFIVDGSAVFVVADKAAVDGATGAYPADETVVAEIQSLGFTVTTVDDDALTCNEDQNVDLLILGSSLGSGTVVGTCSGAFKGSSTPIVTWERNLYDDLGLTAGPITPPDAGTVSASQIDIVDPAHPLAGGLSGTVTVFTALYDMVWAAVTTDAEVVATVYTGATYGDQPVLFVYETGDVLPDGTTAAAKRVGYFLPDFGDGTLTGDGATLLRAAANEALAR